MRRLLRELGRTESRLRRLYLINRVTLMARLHGAIVDIDIDPDIEIRSRVRVEVTPRTRNSITMGPGCRILGDNLIRLKNGHLRFGDTVEVRRGTIINLTGGTFTCEGRNKLSYYNMIHCAESVTFERYASTSEFCSVIDVTHNHDGSDTPFYESEESKPIHIGRNTWMGSKSSVTMGVAVGRNCVIAAHAVVTKDVADGDVVGGVPAKVIASRPVPPLADGDPR